MAHLSVAIVPYVTEVLNSDSVSQFFHLQQYLYLFWNVNYFALLGGSYLLMSDLLVVL
jgi:hypothetical protein